MGKLHNWLLRRAQDKILYVELCRIIPGSRFELPLEKFLALIKEAKEQEFAIISLFGQPSLHKDFQEICQRVNGSGLLLQIETTGLNLSKKFVTKQKKHKTTYKLLLASPDPLINDEVLGKGALHALLHTWSYLAEGEFLFVVPIYEKTLSHIPSIARFVFDELGATRIVFEREKLDKQDDIFLYMNLIKKLNRRYQKLGKSVSLGNAACKDKTCPLIDSGVVINAEGRFTPCDRLLNLPYYSYDKPGDLKHFLETDYRTKINNIIDQHDNRQSTLHTYGVSFCQDCKSNLEKNQVLPQS